MAADADTRAGVPGLHNVQRTENHAAADLALRKLAGVAGGGGGNRGVKPKGVCAQCGGTYPLDKDGNVAKHGKPYGKLRSDVRCAGSKKKPRARRAGPNTQQQTAGA